MRRLLPLLFGLSLQAQTVPLTAVSAASYAPEAPLAPEMIAAAFTTAITTPLAAASSTPLPTTLSGHSVVLRDSAGVERVAGLFAIAPGQVNFLTPAGLAPGSVTVTLRSGDRAVAAGTARVAAVSPGTFSANANGRGAPAGLAQMVGGGSSSVSELFQDSGRGLYLPRPIPAVEGAQQYLILFGTGIRGWRTAVTAAVGGQSVPVAAAVAQGTFVGLDQVNLGPLPASFTDRRGELAVVLTVDGVATNTTTIALAPPGMGQWSTRAQLVEPNSEMAVAQLDGKIYVVGGYPASRVTQATVQVYDPVADRWERTTPLPAPINHTTAVSANGKLYMLGGQTDSGGGGNFSDRVFEYDPATREWRERARMPTARGGGVAVVLDSRIYVAGSRPPRGADFAVYIPEADQWRTLPDLPTQRNHLTGGALGGRIYIVGGRFEGGANSPQSDVVEIFDPVTNAWSRGAPMPRPRGGINAVEAYGCLHVFGGEGNSERPDGVYPDHDVYNPITNTWMRLGQLPIAVHGVTGAAFLNGLIYLPGGGTMIGGSSGSLHHQVYRPGMVCR